MNETRYEMLGPLLSYAFFCLIMWDFTFLILTEVVSVPARDAEPRRGGLWDPTSRGRWTLKGVIVRSHIERTLSPRGGVLWDPTSKGRWTLKGVIVRSHIERTRSPRGGVLWDSTSKGCWTLKGVIVRSHIERTLSLEGVDCEISHWLERKQVPARTLGPERGWIVRSHIDWRGEQVPASSLVLNGDELWDPTSVGERNEIFFIRIWKPLSSICILKSLRRSPKGKAQREHYLLAASLSCYKFTILTGSVDIARKVWTSVENPKWIFNSFSNQLNYTLMKILNGLDVSIESELLVVCLRVYALSVGLGSIKEKKGLNHNPIISLCYKVVDDICIKMEKKTKLS